MLFLYFYAGISLFTFYFIEDLVNQRSIIEYMVIALVVFGYFNIRNNSIVFLGDVGSISIAFVLGYLMMILIYQTHRWEYIIFYSLYGIDSVLTITQRIYNKKIYLNHIDYTFINALVDKNKHSHLIVSAIYSIFQLFINIILLYIIIPNDHSSLISCFLLILLSALYVLIKFKYTKTLRGI